MEVKTYIGFWSLKMKCIHYALYEQSAFKNARAIFFLRQAERARNMGFIWVVKEACLGQGPTLGRCDLAGASLKLVLVCLIYVEES